jgi:hypothetical protein
MISDHPGTFFKRGKKSPDIRFGIAAADRTVRQPREKKCWTQNETNPTVCDFTARQKRVG